VTDSVDLLVVGAGVIGLSAAWRAAQRGLRVCVVERDVPGAGATTTAAGLLSPTDPQEWEGVRGAVNIAAMAAWPSFAADLERAADTSISYRRDGVLRIALDDDDRVELELVAATLQAAGVAHELVDADGVIAAEPGVRGAVAGLLVDSDAHVDTIRLAAALARACVRAGVDLQTGVEPLGALRARDGTIEGIRLSDGTERRAALTVLAAGVWSSQSTWLPAEALPAVRPVAGEYLLLQGDPAAPACRRALRSRYGAVAPRDGGVYWVGTTVREDGFVTLPSVSAIGEILLRCTELVPAFGDLGVLATGVGLRPVSEDRMPYVGASAIAGLALATGHGREGIIHAPLVAEAIAALATGEDPDPLMQPFSPGRVARLGVTGNPSKADQA
jgi:glycine oxidase